METSPTKREKALRRNLLLCVGLGATTQAFSITVPTLLLLYTARGISFGNVTRLEAIFAIVVVVFQIPTGYLADVTRRKNLVVAGACSIFLAAVVIAWAETFSHFVIAEFFAGFGIAAMSGAQESLLAATLNELREERRFPTWDGRVWSGGLLLAAVGSLTSGFLAGMDVVYPVIGTALLACVGITVAVSITEPVRAERHDGKNAVREVFSAFGAIQRNRNLRWLIVFSSVMFGFNQLAAWLYPIRFQACELDVRMYGALYAAFNIVAAISSLAAVRYAGSASRSRVWFGVLTLCVGGGYLVLGSGTTPWSLIGAVGQQFARAGILLSVSRAITRTVSDRERASVYSIFGMARLSAYSLMAFPLGVATEQFGSAVVVSAIGVASLAVGGLVLRAQPVVEKEKHGPPVVVVEPRAAMRE